MIAHIATNLTILLYIDGLSLAMFEALRGLRDASTMDEENGNGSTVTDGDANTSRPEKGINPNNTSSTHQQQDSELVLKLVDAVFEKSHTIDAMLDKNYSSPSNVEIPPLYTNRTKLQQLEYIEELVESNNLVIQELYSVVQETIQQRNLCRQFIIKNSEIILSPLQPFDNDVNPSNTMLDVTSYTGATTEAENVTSTIFEK